jgi:hypothetical protein
MTPPDVFTPFSRRFSNRAVFTPDELKELLEPAGFEMPEETRFSGHWVVGAQGTGKTNLLLHLLSSDLQKDASVIILDAKGQLTKAVAALQIPEMRVIDPSEPVAINPLDVGEDAIDQLLYIFAALADAKVTAKQEAFLRPLLTAIITAFPEPTLATLQGVINRKETYRPYINKLPDDLQHFFDVEWLEYSSTRSELTWRLRLLLQNGLIRSMFSAPKTKFDITREMNVSGPIVINNSQSLVGKSGSAFIGRYFTSEIWRGATARYNNPDHDWKPVFVYLDEADAIIDPTIAEIIDRCRAARIALILAHQRKGQISDANVLSALENCAIKMANVGAEAAYFSKLMHIPQAHMNQLQIGQFATHIRGEQPFIAQIPLAKLPFPEMTTEQAQDLTQTMRARFSDSPAKADDTSSVLPSDSPKHDEGGSSTTW